MGSEQQRNVVLVVIMGLFYMGGGFKLQFFKKLFPALPIVPGTGLHVCVLGGWGGGSC